MNKNVYVLTEQRNVGTECNLSVAVYATKTAAKQELLRRRDDVLETFMEQGSDWQVYENHPTIWGITSTVDNVWTELVVTEQEVRQC